VKSQPNKPKKLAIFFGQLLRHAMDVYKHQNVKYLSAFYY